MLFNGLLRRVMRVAQRRETGKGSAERLDVYGFSNEYYPEAHLSAADKHRAPSGALENFGCPGFRNPQPLLAFFDRKRQVGKAGR
jgi:hypothetical protein